MVDFLFLVCLFHLMSIIGEYELCRAGQYIRAHKEIQHVFNGSQA